jgi:hypothetical protein
MCKTKESEMKNSKLWFVVVQFTNARGKVEKTVIKDRSLQNIMSAVDLIPGAKVICSFGERRGAA